MKILINFSLGILSIFFKLRRVLISVKFGVKIGLSFDNVLLINK